MPIYMHNLNPLSFEFKPTGASVPVYTPEVKGFDAATDPTQDDADAAAAALEKLYGELPAGQQAVLAQILSQAASVVEEPV
jgi:hypothetical protein